MFTWKWMFQYPIRKCQNKLYVFSNFFLYILGHKELLQRMILYGRFIIIEATRRPNLTRGWRSFFFFSFFLYEYFKNLYFSPRNDGKGCQPLEYKSNLVCWIGQKSDCKDMKKSHMRQVHETCLLQTNGLHTSAAYLLVRSWSHAPSM